MRIRDADPDLLNQITDAAAIIGMRNVIAHGYDAISPQRIVAAIESRVPVLIREVESILAS